jgi:hypothetical protein
MAEVFDMLQLVAQSRRLIVEKGDFFAREIVWQNPN